MTSQALCSYAYERIYALRFSSCVLRFSLFCQPPDDPLPQNQRNYNAASDSEHTLAHHDHDTRPTTSTTMGDMLNCISDNDKVSLEALWLEIQHDVTGLNNSPLTPARLRSIPSMDSDEAMAFTSPQPNRVLSSTIDNTTTVALAPALELANSGSPCTASILNGTPVPLATMQGLLPTPSAPELPFHCAPPTLTTTMPVSVTAVQPRVLNNARRSRSRGNPRDPVAAARTRDWHAQIRDKAELCDLYQEKYNLYKKAYEAAEIAGDYKDALIQHLYEMNLLNAQGYVLYTQLSKDFVAGADQARIMGTTADLPFPSKDGVLPKPLTTNTRYYQFNYHNAAP